jgi:hypothetical protein
MMSPFGFPDGETMYKPIAIVLLLSVPALQAFAGKADVLDADVDCEEGVCRFAVTVQHADEGWNHYADNWEILDQDGNVIAVRELAHPHVREQPFTRSLGNVEIPENVDRVVIRSHDSVHGNGGKELVVEIPGD